MWAPWMKTTGSPEPDSSYSSVMPSTSARSMCRTSFLAEYTAIVLPRHRLLPMPGCDTSSFSAANVDGALKGVARSLADPRQQAIAIIVLDRVHAVRDRGDK